MSIWYLMWVFNIAVWLWVALMRLRMCGCKDFERHQTCTRVHWRECYVEWEVMEDIPPEIGMARWGKVSEEHVWANEEFLDKIGVVE